MPDFVHPLLRVIDGQFKVFRGNPVCNGAGLVQITHLNERPTTLQRSTYYRLAIHCFELARKAFRYRIDKSPDLSNWLPVQTMDGSKSSGTTSLTVAKPTDTSYFWRVVRLGP